MSNRANFVVALAGRLIEAPPEFSSTGFPAQAEGKVRDRLRDLFHKVGATTLVASGASGADLLAMEVAGDKKDANGNRTVARKLILPFDPERFLSTSVAKAWESRFRGVLAEVENKEYGDELIVLGPGGDDRERFAEVNRRILTAAEQVASTAGPGGAPAPKPLAVLVWDGERETKQKRDKDLTAAFAREARERRIRCHEVSTQPTTYADRFAPGPTKKMLALEGGGILGLLSIAYLIQIEDELRARLNAGADFVLADYFDYIAGTSTGAIIATLVALGLPARKIESLYIDNGSALCQKRWFFQRWWSKFSHEKLVAMLKGTIGEETTLGSPRLRTGLMLVLRNATTDSPWPLSNLPGAMYNDPAGDGCNLDLPLWQLVRGSTAAPTYYDPEEINIGPKRFVFVDGGVTVYNNPSFQLFAMATVDSYGLMWPADEDRLLLVSIGTGVCPDANENLRPGNLNLRYNATRIPSALIAAASAQQDFLCRMYGRCAHGAPIDGEIGQMLHPGGRGPLGPGAKKQFRYARYNIDLTQTGLASLGLGEIRSEDVIKIDSVDHTRDLVRIGKTAARRDVNISHFDGFV